MKLLKYGQRERQMLLDFFKECWESGTTWESYVESFVSGSTSLKTSLKEIDQDEGIKLAILHGMIDKSWVKELKDHLRDMEEEQKK